MIYYVIAKDKRMKEFYGMVGMIYKYVDIFGARKFVCIDRSKDYIGVWVKVDMTLKVVK